MQSNLEQGIKEVVESHDSLRSERKRHIKKTLVFEEGNLPRLFLSLSLLSAFTATPAHTLSRRCGEP